MPDSARTGLRCPICGETAPEPAWMCLYRIAGSAVLGEPCSYSVEGASQAGDRMNALAQEAIAEVEEARRARARASGIPVNEVGGGDV